MSELMEYVSKKRGAGIPGKKLFDARGNRLPDPKHNGHRGTKPKSGPDLKRQANVRPIRERKAAAGRTAPQNAPRYKAKPPQTTAGRLWDRVNRGSVYGPAAGVTAGAGGGAYATNRKTNDGKQRYSREARTAAGASLAGAGSFAAYGYRQKFLGNKAIRAHEADLANQVSTGKNPRARADYDRQMTAHRKKYGIGGRPGSYERDRAMSARPEYNRNFPPDIPGAKYKRRLGQMSGKRGALMAFGAAAVPGGAVYANESRKVKKRDYGYNEKRVSPLRATEAAVGVSLVGYGLSRNSAFKNLLRVGTKMDGNKGVAARHAERAREGVEHATGQGAKMIQQKTGYQGRGLRPIEALVGGGVVTAHAMPVRRERFTPTGRGW